MHLQILHHVSTRRYMPVLMISALLLGGGALWADVDTVVAAYNVHAYQTGKLETVDVGYLWELGSGAVPQIAKLVDDENPEVARQARLFLSQSGAYWEDFRSWNYADWQAKDCVSEYKANRSPQEKEIYRSSCKTRFFSCSFLVQIDKKPLAFLG